MPTTTTNFFIDCRTIEEVKNRYRDLAKKYHPDLGGDTLTMQAVNIEYSDAMRRAIPSEENEYRREQANAGFEPLREAIEFAVTLPESVSVVIRGFCLWLEGETSGQITAGWRFIRKINLRTKTRTSFF